METILVTGGAGFIGANFVRLALAETDWRVVVLDKLTYAGNLCTLEEVAAHPRYVFERGDIADSATVARIFETYGPARVVNFAAESHVDRSIDSPRPFVISNVVGTFELLDAARRSFAKGSPAARERFRFLHVSTDEVYGSLGADGLFSETTPYAPNSPYSATKAGADHLVRAYWHTYGLPTIITNCSNNYGPFQFPEKLIPLTILNLVEGRPVPIYGDGGNVRDWLYVEDHCRGILLALTQGRPGEKYNIGGHRERTNLQVLGAICAALEELRPAAKNEALQTARRGAPGTGETGARNGAGGVAQYVDLRTFVTDRPGHDRRYAIDAEKIRAELGWKPREEFDTGIRRTVLWYLEYRGWCSQVQADQYDRERLGLWENG